MSGSQDTVRVISKRTHGQHFTAEEVSGAKKLYYEGLTFRDIAKHFGCDERSVSRRAEREHWEPYCVPSLSGEIWKNVEPGDFGYMVSNLGRIKNGRGRLLTQIPSKNGYLQTTMIINGKKKLMLAHRVVAKAFLGLHVNHKDFNKTNNCVENLEYVTRKQNMRHMIDAGRHGGPKGASHNLAKFTDDDIRYIRKAYADGTMRQIDLCRKYGVLKLTIRKITRRESWKHVH